MSRGGDEMLEEVGEVWRGIESLNSQNRTPIMAMPLEFVPGIPHNEAQRLHFSEVFCLVDACILTVFCSCLPLLKNTPVVQYPPL